MGIRNSLSVYVVKWIVRLTVVGVLILLFNIWLVTWGINQNLFLPANEPIKKGETIKKKIEGADHIDFGIIPKELDYAIFDKHTKKLVKSNMSASNEEKAKEAFQHPTADKMSSFLRYDSKYEVIFIHYSLKIQFAHVQLRQKLPNPGVWLVTLSISMYCLYLIWNIRRFSKVIVRENQKLITVASKIKEKDLNIEFPHVRFHEYKDVMGAMQSLSEALARSIQKEIEATNSKAEQISYLVHDIKIPLTVIKGNVELFELMATQDMKENFVDMLHSIKQIEQYIQEVIDINLNNKQIDTDKEEVDTKNFLHELYASISSLGNNISMEDFTNERAHLLITSSLLIRAIHNIVLNALERTPSNEQVRIVVKEHDNRIQFIITDCGPGFSVEALKRGTELFYTENNARVSNSHYGLGLTFVERVIKQNNGSLTLGNNASHSGEVLIELPLKRV